MSDLVEGNRITFKIDKQLVYVKQLGCGGTGEVHLFYEELTDKKYAIKKFKPLPCNDNDNSFSRFVDEIKILVDLNHKNIVRIYTYYLFPNERIGYLQMEYVEGDSIDVYLQNNPQQFDSLFLMAIDAFVYLESKGVLHRDIRFNNLLVSNGELKIIDFGFGKKLTEKNINENSVMIDYPFTVMPEEISMDDWEYEERTEIYFLGYLFKKMIPADGTTFSGLIDKMCEAKKDIRYQSFASIQEDINRESSLFSFNDSQKKSYLKFADSLVSLITKFTKRPEFEIDSKEIICKLEKVYNDNAIEEKIQDNQALINCFVAHGRYFYKSNPRIFVTDLKEFCSMVKKVDIKRKDVVFNGIRNRLSAITIEEKDDLPF